MQEEFMTLEEAADLLQVSRFTLWRLLKEGKLPAYQSEADRRRKLVRREDVEALKRPRRVDPKRVA
jgi:excisionase family DNA binding protein